jgi:hypothetical protein
MGGKSMYMVLRDEQYQWMKSNVTESVALTQSTTLASTVSDCTVGSELPILYFTDTYGCWMVISTTAGSSCQESDCIRCYPRPLCKVQMVGAVGGTLTSA